MKYDKYMVFITCTVLLLCFLSSCDDEVSEVDDGLVFDVPRLENTQGSSILDDPFADRGGFVGLCQKGEVYCNGQCLSLIGDSSENCALLQSNIGLANDITLDDTNLYYTAMSSEILKMDLAALTHSSMVTGLNNPSALYAVSGLLYFGNNPTEGDVNLSSDIRVMNSGRKEVTVLTENIGAVFKIHLENKKLIFGAGALDAGPMYSVSNTGGRWSKFSASKITHLEVVGDTVVFSMDTEGESGLFTSSISKPDRYTKLVDGNKIPNFFVADGFVYWFAFVADNIARVFTKYPLSGGKKQELGSASDGVLLAYNNSYAFYADIDRAAGVSNIMSIPLSGGQSTVLATCEPNEVQGAVANSTHLYLAMGYMRTGGILKIDL